MSNLALDGFFRRIKKAWTRFERKYIPRLVWVNDELDVKIIFTDDKLLPEGKKTKKQDEAPVDGLDPPTYASLARAKVYDLGVTFTSTVGLNTQQWWLDDSLVGPMRVKFIGKTKRPMRRMEW